MGASTSGEITTGARLGRLADRRFVITDMVREQYETNKRDALIKNMAVRDGSLHKQSLPQDSG